MKIAGKDRCINCLQPLDKSGVCSHCSFEEKNYIPSKDELKPGTCLADRYFVGRVLGQGGFGITYVAWDIVLAIRVAIKEYYPQNNVSRNISDEYTEVKVHSVRNAAAYDEGLSAFLREARIMSKFMELPGIVTVRDFFRENNTAYLVMEYVNGVQISSYIKKNGPIPVCEVVCMMEPVINSLASIHAAGYLHKDISANNIMITGEKKLILIDFGAARNIEQSEMTMTVAVKRGFSPEELYRSKGKQGPWSDIYSLCATMYYMITGVVPLESVERVIHDNVEHLADMSDIIEDEAACRAIDRGMAVMTADRYRNIAELYADLYPGNEIPDIVSLGIVNDEIERFDNNIAEQKESPKMAVSHTTLRNELDRFFVEEKTYHRMRTIRNVAVTVVLIAISIAVIHRYMNSTAENDGIPADTGTENAVVSDSSLAVYEDIIEDVPVASDNTELTDSEDLFIVVPHMTGKTYEKAVKELEQEGFVVDKEKEYSKEKKNTVIGQSIAAGTKVADGTMIVLTVSKGKKNADNTKVTNKPAITEKPKAVSKPKSTDKPKKEGNVKKEKIRNDNDLDGILN